MSDDFGILVEFQAKYDTVTKGFNEISKGSDKVISKNKEVDASFEELGAKAKESANTVLNEWLGLGIALSVGGIIEYFNKTAEAIDHLTDTARGLGVSAQDLQKLTYAAGLGGVGMDDLSDSLKKFNITLGQAESGNDQAVQSFKNLGINIDNLKGKDLTTAFITTATAAAKMGNNTVAAADSAAVFGRSYEKALSLGRDGIAENIKGFDELGVTLSDTQRKAVDEFGDTKLKLGTIFDGLMQKIVADVSPAFTELLGKVNDFILKSGGIDKVAQNFAEKIVNAVESATAAFKDIYDKISSVVKTLQDLQTKGVSSLLPNLSDTQAGQLGAQAGNYIKNRLLNPNQDTMQTTIDSLSQLPKKGQTLSNGLTADDYYQQGGTPSSIPNYLNGSSVQDISGATAAALAAVKTATDEASKGLRDWTQALYKSSDMITAAFDTIAGNDKQNTLKQIMDTINDKGLVNPMTRTDMVPRENPNFQQNLITGLNGQSYVATNGQQQYQTDANGNTIYDKQNVFPTASNTQFEADAAEFIAGIKKGNFGGKDASAQFNALRQDAANNANAGLNNSGEIGILDEIKKFADSMGAIIEKPQQVHVSLEVQHTPDYIVKVIKSDGQITTVFTDAMNNYTDKQAQLEANT